MLIYLSSRHYRANARTLACRLSTLLIVFLLPLLTACTGAEYSANVMGLNYSDLSVEMQVTDPTNKKNSVATMGLGPYQAGGVTCCYMLPRKWHPGLKADIYVARDSRYYGTKERDLKYEEVRETVTVDVPQYKGSKGDLYVLRHADGKYEVVVSDVQPDHKEWPGKMKGVPVPSIEYQRDRWDLHLELAKSSLYHSENRLAEFKKNPVKDYEENWESMYKYDRRTLEKNRFNGPSDPNFQAYTRREIQEHIKLYKEKVQQLEKGR